MIETSSLQENGWSIDGDTVRPTWFTSPQLQPPAVQNRKNRKSKLKPGNVADDENSVIKDVSPPLKQKASSDDKRQSADQQ